MTKMLEFKEWIVKQYIVSDPSERGHWYECRRVKARTYFEAVAKAFGEKIPKGYKIELA